MNASCPPAFFDCKESTLTPERSLEVVSPVTATGPRGLIAMDWPESEPVPPRYVDINNSVPESFSFVITASSAPESAGCDALRVGKSREFVRPVIHALFEPSIAMDAPASVPAPPRYVLYRIAVPAAFSLVMKISCAPRGCACMARATGKSADWVDPVKY